MLLCSSNTEPPWYPLCITFIPSLHIAWIFLSLFKSHNDFWCVGSPWLHELCSSCCKQAPCCCGGFSEWGAQGAGEAARAQAPARLGLASAARGLRCSVHAASPRQGSDARLWPWQADSLLQRLQGSPSFSKSLFLLFPPPQAPCRVQCCLDNAYFFFPAKPNDPFSQEVFPHSLLPPTLDWSL